MNAMNIKNFASKLNLSTHKLFESGVIASIGAPTAFVTYENMFVLKGSFEFRSTLTIFMYALLVSFIATMILTTITYLLAKLLGKLTINVGLVSAVYLIGFSFFVFSDVDFSEYFDVRMAVFFIGLASANAFIFIFLAHRWSKKSEL